MSPYESKRRARAQDRANRGAQVQAVVDTFPSKDASPQATVGQLLRMVQQGGGFAKSPEETQHDPEAMLNRARHFGSYTSPGQQRTVIEVIQKLAEAQGARPQATKAQQGPEPEGEELYVQDPGDFFQDLLKPKSERRPFFSRSKQEGYDWGLVK